MPAQRLYELDGSSTRFPEQLDELLHDKEWVKGLELLPEGELMELVDYLDNILDGLDRTGSPFRNCLRVLREVCSSRVVLPSTYGLSGPLSFSTTQVVASGRFSDTLKGSLGVSDACVKRLRVSAAGDRRGLERALCQKAVTWKYLNHPNVAPFEGATLEPLQLVSEWIPGGELREHVRNNDRVNLVDLSLGVAKGLAYLHLCNVIHGNLKGANIVVDARGNIKITDFCCAAAARDSGSVVSAIDSYWGTAYRYTAPEVLMGVGSHSKESDVFAFGMVMIEIFTGKEPFSESLDCTAIESIVAGDRPKRATDTRFTDRLWTLVQQCWGQRPQDRPRMDQVIMELLFESSGSEIARQLRHMAETQPNQELINGLDKGKDGDISSEDRPELLNILGRMCRRLKTIPASMHIENCPNEPMDEEYGGGCGTVSRGEYQGRPVAIKTLHMYITSDFEERFGKFRREVVAWRHLQHPNILPFIGVNLERHRLAMVSEWMDHGNINEFIKNNEGVNRAQLLADAANGLEYMHSIHMVHGDLKGANIVIGQGLRACLADFGLSTIVGIEHRAAVNASSISVASEISLMSFTSGGTTRWMSPELLDPDRFGITDYRPTKQSDCYAFGMVIYEVLCGDVPFLDITNHGGVILAIMKGDRPPKPEGAEGIGFTKGLWKIVERCWLVDANERPDVGGVLSQLNHAAWSWNRRRLR